MMNDFATRLDALAAAQEIEDPEVAHCWELVRYGIQTHALGLGNLGRVIAQLRAGGGAGFDELSLDIEEPPSAGRATVNLLDDVRSCPAPALIAALERLRESGESEAGGDTPSGPR